MPLLSDCYINNKYECFTDWPVLDLLMFVAVIKFIVKHRIFLFIHLRAVVRLKKRFPWLAACGYRRKRRCPPSEKGMVGIGNDNNHFERRYCNGGIA